VVLLPNGLFLLVAASTVNLVILLFSRLLERACRGSWVFFLTDARRWNSSRDLLALLRSFDHLVDLCVERSHWLRPIDNSNIRHRQVQRSELALLQGVLEDLPVEVGAHCGHVQEEESGVVQPDGLFFAQVESAHELLQSLERIQLQPILVVPELSKLVLDHLRIVSQAMD